ncbi:MAG: hypothetical protein ACL93V_15655 [Candidatus Electrothrix sp. YB6]
MDILASPGRALQQGIMMIPALQAGEKKLSGIFLSAAKVRRFVQETLTGEDGG